MKLPSVFSRYFHLPASIYALFFAIIINRLGNFVIPFLSMYLTKNLNFDTDKAGLFVMLVSLAGIPGILIGGILVDRIGRKSVLTVFQFLSACCFIPCVFFPYSSIVPWLMVFSVFFSETAQVAHNAMVADLTRNENRNEAFSLIYLGVNIGFSIGPILAGFLFRNHLRVFFMIDSLTTLISVILILLFTKETIHCIETDEINCSELSFGEKSEEGNLFQVLLKRPFFLAFIIINFLYTIVYVQDSFSLPLYIDKLFPDDSSKVFGLVMTTNAVFVVFASTIISMLTRKFRTIANIGFAGILYGIGFGMIFFIKSFPMLVISTIIWTTGEILASVNTNVYLSEHSPISHRGRFNSIRLFVRRAGMALGPLLAGIVIKTNGLKNIWGNIFLLSIFASIGVFVIYHAENIYLNKEEAKVNL